MKILIASDHAGYKLKQNIIHHLKNSNFVVDDLGADSEDRVDYPDFANKLAEKMIEDINSIGVLICGSGVGISIAANRHRHIRAALCNSPEVARLSRQHNNANVICFGARFIDQQTAIQCLDEFLDTPFEGGRHLQRVDKLS